MAYVWGGNLDKGIDLFTEDVNVASATALGVLGDGKLRSIEAEPVLLEAGRVNGISKQKKFAV